MYLVPRLRTSGAILLLPLYAYMAYTGTTLPYFILPIYIYIFTYESNLNFHFMVAWLIPLQRLEKVKTCQCRCVRLEVNVSLNG